MQDYWVNFARSGNPNGNPNGPNLPQWPAYSAANNSTQCRITGTFTYNGTYSTTGTRTNGGTFLCFSK